MVFPRLKFFCHHDRPPLAIIPNDQLNLEDSVEFAILQRTSQHHEINIVTLTRRVWYSRVADTGSVVPI
jgi:hypothetical protein